MPGINYGRVFLGGLVAGVVANACDLATGVFLMAEETDQMVQRLGLNRDVVAGSTVAISWIIVDFIYATLIVWTYAAVRPRLGPGPKTAMTVGLVVFGAVTAILFGFSQMGFFTTPAFMKSAFLSAVTTVLASLAGAWVYREE
jgi:magnesium-transporting ATPase (P-type)